MPEVGELYVKITARMDEFERQMKRLEGDTPRRMQKMAEASGLAVMKTFGDYASRAGSALTIGVSLPLVALGKTIFDNARKMEALESSMTVMLGSSSRARQELSELRKMSDSTATSYESLASAAQGISTGFRGNLTETNYVLKNFAALSSASNVSAEDFKRLAINLTQVGGSAKLTGDELRESASILPKLRELLKTAFGTSETENLAKMGVTGRQALLGIAREIEKSKIAPNLQTVNAQLMLMQNEFLDLSKEAGKALLPVANDLIKNTLIPNLKAAAKYIGNMSDEQRRGALNWLAYAAAAGPAFKILGGGISVVSNLIKVTTAYSAALAAQAVVANTTKIAVLGLHAAYLGLAALAAVPIYFTIKYSYEWLDAANMALEKTEKRAAKRMSAGEFVGEYVEKHANNPSKGFFSTTTREDARKAAMQTPTYKRLKAQDDAEYEAKKKAEDKAGREAADKAMGGFSKSAGGGKGSGKSGGANKSTDEITADLLVALGKSVTTPKGQASCAFFASEVLRQTGVAVSKEGSAKSLIDSVKKQGGVEVKRSAAKAGDLVYYYGDGYGKIDHNPNKKGQQGYHVGIYKGDGTVVDSSGGVKRFNRGIGADARFVRPLRSGRYQNVGDVSMERVESVEAARQEAQKAAKEAAEESARQWKIYQEALTDSLRPIREFQWAKQAERMQADGAMRYDVISTREFGKSFLDLSDETSKNRIRAIAMREVDTEEKAKRGAMIDRNQNAWKELFELAGKRADEKSSNKKMSDRNRDAWKNIFNRAGKEGARMDQQALDRYSDAMADLSEQHARLGGLTQVNEFRLRALAVEFGRGATESERYATGLERAKQYMAEQLKLQNWQQWRELFDQVAQSLATPIRDALSDLVRLDFPDFFRNFGGLVDQALSDMANKIIDMQIKLQIQKGTDWVFGHLLGGGGGVSGFDSGFQWSGSWDSASSPVLASASSSRLASSPQVVQNLVINVGGSPSRETLQQVQVAAYQGMQEALRSNG